jgi:hypothetical protein
MRPVVYPPNANLLNIDGSIQSVVQKFLAPTAGVATAVAAAQVATTGVPLTINGTLTVNLFGLAQAQPTQLAPPIQEFGIGYTIPGAVYQPFAQLDVARYLAVVSTNAGDTSTVLNFVGTTFGGLPISESLTTNGTTIVYTKNQYLTVTSIGVSGSTSAGNVTVGTGTSGTIPVICTTPPIIVPFAEQQVGATVTAVVTGTVSCQLQYTTDDPFVPNPDVACTWINQGAAFSVNTSTAFVQNVRAYRVQIVTNTPPGGAQITVIVGISSVAL